jgi:2-phosphosulfolactate phosphatase
MSANTRKTVAIDVFNAVKPDYDKTYAIVAVDVIRATTTAITGVAQGRKCYPVSSIEEATALATKLENALLVGELGGNMPYGFDLQNSPFLIASRTDVIRPMILLSTSGTRLITEFKDHDFIFPACLRNIKALIPHLAAHHNKVALIGAGTRGEFREEDQLCCARIAEGLVRQGFKPENEKTAEIIEHWRNASVEIICDGNSAAYLRRSGQTQDLDFILAHVDDLHFIYQFKEDQIVELM